MSGSNPDQLWNLFPVGPVPLTGGEQLLMAQSNSPTAPIYRYSSAAFSQLTPATFNVIDYGAFGNLVVSTGTISWSGTSVTITGSTIALSGATATGTGDIGKVITMPAGFDNSGTSVAGVTTIEAVNTTTGVITVSDTAAHPFSNMSTVMGKGAPTTVTVNAGGTGDLVGDIKTLVGGTFARAATFTVGAITIAAAPTVVNGGSNGPANWPVHVSGTTGYGNRFLAYGTTDANGTLTGAPLTLESGGDYWANPQNLTSEPVSALTSTIVASASFANGSTTIACSTVGMLLGGRVNASHVPSGAYITAVPNGGTIIISAATTGTPDIGETVQVINNTALLQGTYSNTANSNTITLTSGPSLSLRTGMAISGTTINGSGNPRDNATTTIGTIVSGNTLVLAPVGSGNTGTNLADPNAKWFVWPMLEGASVSMTTKSVLVTYNDVGCYSALPSFPAATSGGTGTGLTITPVTRKLLFKYFNDDTPGINAAFAAARTAANSVSGLADTTMPMCVVFPSAAYGCLTPINATAIASQSFTIQGNGSVIYSYALGGLAFDLFASRWTAMTNISVLSDGVAPPLVGLAGGATGATLGAANGQGGPWIFDNIFVQGNFQLAAGYAESCEGMIVRASQFLNDNGAPWTGLYNGPYGFIHDGSYVFNGGTSACGPSFPNSTKVSSTFAPQARSPNTFVSYEGPRMVNASVLNNGVSPAMFISGTQSFHWDAAYAVSYTSPAVVVQNALSGGTGSSTMPTFDINVEGQQNDTFFFAGPSHGGGMPNWKMRAYDIQSTNSFISMDYLGYYGATCTGFVNAFQDIEVQSLPITASYYDPGLYSQTAATVQNVYGKIWIGGAQANNQYTDLVGAYIGQQLLSGATTVQSLNATNITASSAISTGNFMSTNILQANQVSGEVFFMGGEQNVPAQFMNLSGARQWALRWLGVSGGGAHDADLFFDGILSVQNGVAIASNTSTGIGNGGTFTFGGTIDANGALQGVAPELLVLTSTSIATATVVLPNETIFSSNSLDGLPIEVACTGTIGTITWVSPNGWTVNLPTTISPTTAIKGKTKNSLTTWIPR